MHEDHGVFIAGVEDLRKVIVTFISKDDGGLDLTRTCAPMDSWPKTAGERQVALQPAVTSG